MMHSKLTALAEGIGDVSDAIPEQLHLVHEESVHVRCNLRNLCDQFPLDIQLVRRSRTTGLLHKALSNLPGIGR